MAGEELGRTSEVCLSFILCGVMMLVVVMMLVMWPSELSWEREALLLFHIDIVLRFYIIYLVNSVDFR